MKKISALITLLFSFIVVIAQNDDASNYASIITSSELKKHLTIIASDEFEGRETGTEGQRKAAAYIQSHFEAIDLKSPTALKSYQQFYPLYQDSLTSVSLIINGKTAELGKDYYTQLKLSETQKLKCKKAVFVGYGIDDKNYSDYKNINVKGKTVIFFLGVPQENGKPILTDAFYTPKGRSYSEVNKKLAIAFSKGAVAAFIIDPNQEKIDQSGMDKNKKTNLYCSWHTTKPFNHAFLSHDLAKKILGNDLDVILQITKANQPIPTQWMKERKVTIQYKFNKYRRIVNASNVVGIVEGTDKKDEYVFVTAHYDHLGKRNGKIYYGADDDGSGTAGVMVMAQAFAKAKAEGKGPRRTMVFMTVSGEEKGLWGSEYYSEHPFFPLEKTSVNLNIDMVGRVDTERKTADTLNYVYVVGHDKLSSELPVINEDVNNKYTQLTLDYKFDDPNDKEQIYFRSDHYNFARKGIPVLFFYDGMLLADYHQPTDTVEKINWDLYEKRVRMIFHTAWEIANREKMLKRDIPLPEASRYR